jgi:hypothetical protein
MRGDAKKDILTLRYDSGVIIPSQGTGFRQIRQESAAEIRTEIGNELPELEACRS